MLKSRLLRRGSADEDALTGCFVFLILIVLAPFATLLNAYVLLQNYIWFLAPIQGAPTLTIGNMVGVSLIVAMLTIGLAQSDPKDKDKSVGELAGAAIAKMVCYPLVFWFFGWIYHYLFMR